MLLIIVDIYTGFNSLNTERNFKFLSFNSRRTEIHPSPDFLLFEETALISEKNIKAVADAKGNEDPVEIELQNMEREQKRMQERQGTTPKQSYKVSVLFIVYTR